jgi:adenylate cyclase
MSETTRRRLAAILAADIAGYSRLVGADEEGTLAAFKAHRAGLIDGEIELYGGRIANTAGDSMLIEFPSAVDAVRCALAIQQGMAKRNEDIAFERRIEFRVGINVGDVVVEGDDLLGDGVNIAARLEGICTPGGIALSSNVYDYIEGRINESFTDEGERKLKNIARSVRTYVWQIAKKQGAPVVSLSNETGRRSTIALSSFEPIGRGEDAEVLAADVTDAVRSALSNQTGLTLMTDPARADFLAKGSIQALGGRYRATVEILDLRSGEQFASDRFDGTLDDLFDTEEELAFRISTSVRFAIYPREFERAGTDEQDDNTTKSKLAKAGYQLLNENPAEWRMALELADEVIERDSDNFMAFAIKAMAHLFDVLTGVRPVSPHDGEAASAAAGRAVKLNQNSDFAHHTKAVVHLFYEGDLDAAKRESERALELNPHYPLAMATLGLTTICQGDAETGIRLCTKVVKGNPRLPNNRRFMRSIAYGYFVQERYEEAVEWAQRSDRLAANTPATLITLATAASHGGEQKLAASTVARLLVIYPDLTIGRLWRLPFRNDAHWLRFVDGLRKAGLPE